MTIAVPSLRAVVCTPQWVRNDLWRRARALPSLDLQFADRKSLVDAIRGQNLITFTRASGGTYVDSAGVLQTAGANEPRFDHNPTTGESLGLLVEEQGTNSIRNNTMQGAVAGTPGTVPTNWSDIPAANGLNRQIVGIGTQAGISYIDIRYSGTASATASIVLQSEPGSATVAATGQSWTASSWLALAAGSTSGLTIVQRVTGRSSVGGFIESVDNTVALSATLTRYSASITMANASTLRVSNDIALSYASGATIDITLRIGMTQLEQGAFATSVIPTTSSAATRNADVASITGTNFSSWYRQDEGTVFGEWRAPLQSIASALYSFNDGTANNRISSLNSAAQFLAARNTNGAGAVFSPATSNAPVSGLNRNAIAFASPLVVLSGNGGPVATASDFTAPAVAGLDVGNQLQASRLNGHIRRLTYWSQRLPNATLQALTQ